MESSPTYDAPPVIETVLGVQFTRLPKFSSAHAGWFWKNYLTEGWVNVQEAVRLDDAFERFGDDTIWGPPAALRITQELEPVRIQIIHKDDERMLQVQDSRFIYNWRKQKLDYPRYEKLLPEFERLFERFRKFITDAGMENLELNQWEVTYVNHIPKGELWQSARDWREIFPNFYVPGRDIRNQELETINATWRLVLGDNRGRLHVSLSHGRVRSPDAPEVLVLQFTARGPIDPKKGLDLKSGFTLGHQSIVQTFDAMGSEKAHKYWQRKGGRDG